LGEDVPPPSVADVLQVNKMSMYKHMALAWRKTKTSPFKDAQRERYIKWRSEGSLVRVDRPTRLDKARSLGYKAKQGILVVRSRVKKGGRKRTRPVHGRRPKRAGAIKFSPGKNLQTIAEVHASRKYANLEVLNSYIVGNDGVSAWYEVIMIDPNHPVIKSDRQLSWITEGSHRGRAFRGLTTAGKRGRGLANKGWGTEKV
jgi:large subunit ribosomal protein L15e